MINVTEINPLALPSLYLSERRTLPECPAIYFVIDESSILYIGRTANLAQRLTTHHRINQFKNNHRIAWLECGDENLLPDIEKALISYFNPLLNGTKIDEADRQYRQPRIMFTCSEETKTVLEIWAADEGRTLSNLMERLILEAIELKGKNYKEQMSTPKKEKT